MSLFDKSKRALGEARDQAGRLAGQHVDKVDRAIDRGGSYLDKRTKGKYSGRIHKVGDSAKAAATRWAAQHGDGGASYGPQAPVGQAQAGPPDPVDAPEVHPPHPVDPADPIDRSDPNAGEPHSR